MQGFAINPKILQLNPNTPEWRDAVAECRKTVYTTLLDDTIYLANKFSNGSRSKRYWEIVFFRLINRLSKHYTDALVAIGMARDALGSRDSNIYAYDRRSSYLEYQPHVPNSFSTFSTKQSNAPWLLRQQLLLSAAGVHINIKSNSVLGCRPQAHAISKIIKRRTIPLQPLQLLASRTTRSSTNNGRPTTAPDAQSTDTPIWIFPGHFPRMFLDELASQMPNLQIANPPSHKPRDRHNTTPLRRLSRTSAMFGTADNTSLTPTQEFLAWALPVEYIEEMPSIQQKVRNVQGESTPGVVVFEYLRSLSERVWVAEEAERGSLLVAVQHGGRYGLSRTHHWEEKEIGISDYYATWGWGGGRSKLVKLPAPRLIEPSITQRATDPSGLLLVANSRARADNDSTDHQRSNMRPYGLEPIAHLIGCIRTNDFDRDEIIVRTRSKELAELLSDRTLVDEQGRDRLVVVDSMTIEWSEHWSTRKLAVIDGLHSTSLLECLAAGLPCIVLDRYGLLNVRPRFVSLIDQLIDSQVLHLTAESAAGTINRVLNNVDVWWNEDHRKSLVEEFRRLFACTSSDPAGDWSGFLSKVAGEL